MHPGIKIRKRDFFGSEKVIAFHIHQRVLQGFNFPEYGSFLACYCPLESGTVCYILRSYEFSFQVFFRI